VTPSRTGATIEPEYRPSLSDGLAIGIVDYVIHLEPFSTAGDIIRSFFSRPNDSINHISHDGLRKAPIAVSIVTHTESQTADESKVQLGVWLAAQVARIEALARRCGQLDIISQTVFPLIDVQSETWSLFLARVTPSDGSKPAGSKDHVPESSTEIFHSRPLGNTASPVQTYRLLKNLRVLRTWVDEDYRQWWDDFLVEDSKDELSGV
jgi:hypothetical protein